MLFYTVPITKSELRFNTPIEAKCLVGYYFEVKYSKLLDFNPFSLLHNLQAQKTCMHFLSVGSKRLFNDLLIYPFSVDSLQETDKKYGIRKYRYQDVYIPTAINVNQTEVVVQGIPFIHNHYKEETIDGAYPTSDNQINLVLIFDTEKNAAVEKYVYFEFAKGANFQKKLDYVPRGYFFYITSYAWNNIFTPKSPFLAKNSVFENSFVNIGGSTQWTDTDTNIVLNSLSHKNTWKKVRGTVPEDETNKNIIMDTTLSPTLSTYDIITCFHYNKF
jgi:hypothetical protein